MKITTLICDNCDKEFLMEYFDGGYIDHMNMVNNFPQIYRRGVDAVVKEICMNGNDFRGEYDIETRQECFIQWLKKQKVEKNIIDKIIEDVENQKIHISQLDLIRKKIQTDLNQLPSTDRKYIINHLST